MGILSACCFETQHIGRLSFASQDNRFADKDGNVETWQIDSMEIADRDALYQAMEGR